MHKLSPNGEVARISHQFQVGAETRGLKPAEKRRSDPILSHALVCILSLALPSLTAPASLWANGQNSQAPNGFSYWALGIPAVAPSATAGGAALMGGGGGSGIDDAFCWMCRRSGNGNFLVLGASGRDEDNLYVRRLCPQTRSVQTLIVSSRAGASDSFVAEKIRHADALFIQGGDQSNYIKYWMGTPMQDAINAFIARGGVLGGKSAGLAVLGQFVFAALQDTVTSRQALADPYDSRVTLVRGFLEVPHLRGIITDTHFVARDRLGRTLVFLARIMQDGWARQGLGVAVDENNTLLLESDGTASLTGPGAAYFFRARQAPQVCRAGLPLTLRHVEVYRISSGDKFNLATWAGSGGTAYDLSAEAGVLHSSQPGGALY